ncbi:MAG: hypothetical protein FJ044_02470 [Candidatus Cloacimonetes bacterium]|nr:hypothetical protein [Candidatus Cloacimonadota bacterium]
MPKGYEGAQPEIKGQSAEERPRPFVSKEEALQHLKTIFVNPRDIAEPPEEVKKELGPPDEERVRIEIADLETAKKIAEEKITANFGQELKDWRLKFFKDEQAKKRCQDQIEKKGAKDWGIKMATEIAVGNAGFDLQRSTRQAVVLAEIAGAGLGILDQNNKSELATMLKYRWPEHIERQISQFVGEKNGITSEVFSARTLSEEELRQAKENLGIARAQGWLFEKISYLFPPYIEQVLPPGVPHDLEIEPTDIRGRKILGEARQKDSLTKMMIDDLEIVYVYPTPKDQETPRNAEAWIEFYQNQGIKLPGQIEKGLRAERTAPLSYQQVFQLFKRESFTPLKVMIGEEETSISVGQRQEFDALKKGVRAVLKEQMSVPDALLRNGRGEIIGFVECKSMDSAERQAFLEQLEEELQPTKDKLEVSAGAQEVEDLREALLGESERFVLPQDKLRLGIDIKGEEEFYYRVREYIIKNGLGVKINPLQTIILRLSADWRQEDLERLERLMQARITRREEVLAEAETVCREVDVINQETAEVTKETQEFQLPEVVQFTPMVYIERLDLFSAPELRIVAREILRTNP